MWHVYSTQIITLVIVAVIGLGTIVYRVLEDWSWVDSLDLSVITLATVGYGDLAPSSAASKIFTVFYLASGLALPGTALQLQERVGVRIALISGVSLA